MQIPKVLLLDDQTEALNIMVQCFNKNETGYTLFQTVSPIQALDIAAKMQPDLIITDWMMPKMNGLEFIAALRANPLTAHILVIMTTGIKTDVTDLYKALNTGAIDFIQKPFAEIELLARTNSMLKLARSYKQLIEQQDIIHQNELTIAQHQARVLQSEIDENKSLLLNKNLDLGQMIALNQSLLTKLKQLHIRLDEPNATELQQIISQHSYLAVESTWAGFQISFDNKYPLFYDNLQKQHTSLTGNEKRMCAFMRINLTIKEISAITFQTPDTIRKARVRLRKKLGIANNISLHKYLMNF